MKKLCIVCGEEFEALRNSRTCSEECSKTKKRKYNNGSNRKLFSKRKKICLEAVTCPKCGRRGYLVLDTMKKCQTWFSYYYVHHNLTSCGKAGSCYLGKETTGICD